jgi:hypothetical protein
MAYRVIGSCTGFYFLDIPSLGNNRISAQEEPQVWANNTAHDSVIFADNDYEVFINHVQHHWTWYDGTTSHGP